MKTLNEFIANLTGQEGIPLSKLSSAQKARAIAWAREAGIDLDDGLSSIVANENIAVDNINYSEFVPVQVKTGIDIQSIREFFPVQIGDLKADKSLLNIFTMSEMTYAESKAEPLTHLTGMFALKEAIMKASNTMLKDISVLEITHDSDGAPKYTDFTLSLSYTGDLVVAVAVRALIERRDADNFGKIESRLLALESSLKLPSPKRRSVPFSVKVGFMGLLSVCGYYLLQYVRLHLL